MSSIPDDQCTLRAESAPDRADGNASVGLYEVGADHIVRRELCAGAEKGSASKLGRSALELLPQQERAHLQQRLQDAFATGRAGSMQYRLRQPDGEDLVLEARISPASVRDTVPDAIHIAIIDITERAQRQLDLEAALREADMFRRMVDLASQAIGTADLDGRVIYQNPALLRLLGNSSLAAAQEHSYEDFYRPEGLEYLRGEVIPTVLAEGHWTQGDCIKTF